MRSTRGHTRADRPHFTAAARVTVPATSNSAVIVPGTPASALSDTAASGTRPRGATRRNTNTRLRDGGISSYYRPRERGYAL